MDAGSGTVASMLGSLKNLPEIIGTQTAVSHTMKLCMFTNNSYRTLLRIVRVATSRTYYCTLCPQIQGEFKTELQRLCQVKMGVTSHGSVETEQLAPRELWAQFASPRRQLIADELVW